MCAQRRADAALGRLIHARARVAVARRRKRLAKQRAVRAMRAARRLRRAVRRRDQWRAARPWVRRFRQVPPSPLRTALCRGARVAGTAATLEAVVDAALDPKDDGAMWPFLARPPHDPRAVRAAWLALHRRGLPLDLTRLVHMHGTAVHDGDPVLCDLLVGDAFLRRSIDPWGAQRPRVAHVLVRWLVATQTRARDGSDTGGGVPTAGVAAALDVCLRAPTLPPAVPRPDAGLLRPAWLDLGGGLGGGIRRDQLRDAVLRFGQLGMEGHTFGRSSGWVRFPMARLCDAEAAARAFLECGWSVRLSGRGLPLSSS